MTEELPDVNHIHPLENFVEGGIEFLPSGIFLDRPNFLRSLEIFLERLKAVDEMMVNLADGRLLSEATGVNLDEIGRQVGILRNGLEDNEYRAVLMVLTGSSQSHGTRGDVIRGLTRILGEGNFDTYKGTNFRFDINVFDSCFELTQVLDEIVDMLPLPTHLRLVESDGVPFGFDGDDHSFGFGSVNDEATDNGGFSSLIYVSEQENPRR